MIRSVVWGTLAATVAGLAGCATRSAPPAAWDDAARSQTNEWAVRSAFEAQARRSVETRRTLHPHHFTFGTPTLNERGEREAAVIAAKLAADGGGVVYVPGEGVDAELDTARTRAIRALMAATVGAAGVDPSLVRIETDAAGPGGTPSARARADAAQPSSDQPYAIHGSGGSLGGR